MLTFRVASRVNQHGEWVVMAFENDKRSPEYDAFESDQDAAIATCKVMMKHEFGILSEGCRDYGDGAGMSWTIMKDSPEHVDWWIKHQYEDGYNGGPGQPYSRRPVVERRNRLVIITQSYGLDI